MIPPRPQPDVNEISQGYWDGAKQHKLVIQQCGDCSTFIHFPMALCPNCQSENLGFTEVSGRGTVYSFAIVHQNFHPAFTPPYVIALTDLDDAPGIRMYTNILDVKPEAVEIGMPVQATFEDIGEGTVLPQFKPV
ncbi:Zn-ribbon domain-containing OB-fold protein [Jatrophihabitans sp. DSM 45814]